MFFYMKIKNIKYVRNNYDKNIDVLVWPGAAHAPIAV